MKAVFTGKINLLSRREEKGDSIVELQLHMKGKVEDAPQNAKDGEIWTTLWLKPIVVDTLKVGSKITITIEEVIEAEQ